MNKLYNRIMTRLAADLIGDAFVEGYELGLTRGEESNRKRIVVELEKFGVEKFNNDSLTLGYNTALNKVKESK
jgi:hypothetical protein